MQTRFAACQTFSVSQRHLRRAGAWQPDQRCMLKMTHRKWDIACAVQVAVNEHAWIFFLLWAISFVCVMTLSSNERMRRVHPYNYITFIIFTLSFGLIVGILTAFFDTQLLLMALGITAAAVAFMFIIAAATGFDFTQAGECSLPCSVSAGFLKS